MANKARNARKHCERVGDVNSPKNIKTRLAALEMAWAICKNYPMPQVGERELKQERLPFGYIVTRYRGSTTLILFGGCVSGYDFPDCYTIQQVWHYRNSECSESDFVMAEQLSKDVAHGLLESIRMQIANRYGEKEAAKFWLAVGY